MKIFHNSYFIFDNSLKGQTLIEILIAIGIASIILPAIITGFISSRDGKIQQAMRLEASSLLTETQEAVRSVREKGWAEFAVNGTFHPVISGSTWNLAAGTTTVNDFTQAIVISDVYRNTLTGPIVNQGDPGAILDPSTKKIDTTISWATPYASSITATMYLTRHQENAAYTETTQTQFNAGTLTRVVVRATNPPAVADDGEIILGSGGHSDWCTPTLESETVDLPKNGVANALYAIPGAAFTTTGENSSGISYAQVSIGDSPPYPPDANLQDTFDGYKTNSVFGDENYAYIATDNNSKEVVIVDLNNVVGGKYQQAGYFNAPGNNDGKSVFILGSTGYVTVDNTLYNFDVSSMSNCNDADGCPIRDTNGVTLAGNGNSVVVIGNYAYVAINGSPEIQIVDISNATSLTVVGQADINAQGAVDVALNSTTTPTKAYLATGGSGTQNELFVIDVTNPPTGNRSTLGTYDTNGMSPKAVTAVPGNRIIIAGSSGEEYQVVDETSMTKCGFLELNDGVNDIASVLEDDNDAFTYILVGADPEFRMAAGGPGGSYATTGEFESQTFNPGYTTANNRFSASFSEPGVTTLEFQVSMASLSAGVCPTTGNYTFVGPDGTSNTKFQQSSTQAVTFPFASYQNYTNPGQCIRYKAYFSSNGSIETPVLNDVTVNYSP